MTVGEFAGQMALAATYYTPLPLEEAVGRLAAGRALPDRTLCVTFDDGFKNTRTVAFPVLKKLEIPFTVFVATDLPESGRPPWPEELFLALMHSTHESISFEGESLPLLTPANRETACHRMMRTLSALPPGERATMQAAIVKEAAGPGAETAESPFTTLGWADIKDLSSSELVRFGSHTRTHEILTNCTTEQSKEQMRVSRDMLLERLGYCDLLAYPLGHHSADIRRAARELGYRAAVTTECRLNSRGADLFALGRLGIGAGWSLDRFERRLLGY